MKPHAIVTCCDAKYGDFLIQHWLRSLRDHVNLDQIDIVVIDYGLTADQANALRAQQVRLWPAKKDGSHTNIRYRDLAALLEDSRYDQVLSIDGGDIIFQADLSHLFEQNKESFRAVPEIGFTGSMFGSLLGTDDVRPGSLQEILTFLWDKPTINGGVVLGPARRFIEFYAEFTRLCQSLVQFATDQLILSYFLYKTGFVALDEKYNFVLMTTRSGFRVRNGVFVDADGQPIPIVHNSGQHDWIRTVRNFGYGPERNQVKWLHRAYLQFTQSVVRRWKRQRPPAPAR